MPRCSRLRLPRGRGTGSRHPHCGTSRTGPAIPRPGPPRPGRTGQVPAFRSGVAPCAHGARAADQPHPAVHTPRSRSLRSPSWRCTPVQAPVLCLPGQVELPVLGALDEAPPLVSGEPRAPDRCRGPWSHGRRPCLWNATSTHPTSLLPSALNNCARSVLRSAPSDVKRVLNTPEVSPPPAHAALSVSPGRIVMHRSA